MKEVVAVNSCIVGACDPNSPSILEGVPAGRGSNIKYQNSL